MRQRGEGGLLLWKVRRQGTVIPTLFALVSTAVLFFSCTHTFLHASGEFHPVRFYGYTVQDDAAVFNSQFCSFRVTGTLVHKEEDEEESTIDVDFFRVADTLLLPYEDAVLRNENLSRSFRLIEANGTDIEEQRAATLVPSHNYQISFRYRLSDSSIVRTSGHGEQVRLKLTVVRLRNGEQIISPEFVFEFRRPSD